MTVGQAFVTILVVFVVGFISGVLVTFAALSTPRNTIPRLKA